MKTAVPYPTPRFIGRYKLNRLLRASTRGGSIDAHIAGVETSRRHKSRDVRARYTMPTIYAGIRFSSSSRDSHPMGNGMSAACSGVSFIWIIILSYSLPLSACGWHAREWGGGAVVVIGAVVTTEKMSREK